MQILGGLRELRESLSNAFTQNLPSGIDNIAELFELLFVQQAARRALVDEIEAHSLSQALAHLLSFLLACIIVDRRSYLLPSHAQIW